VEADEEFLEEGDAMKTVLVRGPLLSESGYGNHARQVFSWIVKKHPDCEVRVQVLPWGSTSWLVNPDAENGIVGEIMKRTGPLDKKYDVSYQIQLPNEWDTSLANFNVGVTAVVEADRCNPNWINSCNSMNCVVVPSEFCKKVLLDTGNVTTKVEVVPESFIPEVLDENCKFDAKFETNFNFLILGTMTGNNPFNDRKNIFFAIKWICEEFANDPDVGIILKTNVGRGTKLDWPHVENVIRKAVNEVRKGPYPMVHIIHGITSQEEVAGLYRHPQVKALVAPTRGEGFGLPILEAAASGLPVAATEYSGHMDFMKHGKFIRFEYDLNQIHESRCDENIWMRGSKWAEVRESDFKKKLRKFKNSSSVPKQWADELAKKVRDSHSPNAIANEYERVIGYTLS
jgi:glycosyltransferase involved in cell wall biosynthesis